MAFGSFLLSGRTLILAGAVGTALLFAFRSVSAQVDSLEYAVKATYLYKFAPFVDWPRTLPPSADFSLCVVGDETFGAVLEQAVRGQRVDTHPLAVRRLAALDRGAECRIAFLSGAPGEIATNLSLAADTPILTVTDNAPSVKVKGVINFVTLNNRVRFEIDNEAALRKGLTISSKLLSLAVR